MKPRAVIFDVYSTLLEVADPPGDGEQAWRALLHISTHWS
jgi:FMN phosphatase YigB (HAD superfamily)